LINLVENASQFNHNNSRIQQIDGGMGWQQTQYNQGLSSSVGSSTDNSFSDVEQQRSPTIELNVSTYDNMPINQTV